jgi:hypothetical protein
MPVTPQTSEAARRVNRPAELSPAPAGLTKGQSTALWAVSLAAALYEFALCERRYKTVFLVSPFQGDAGLAPLERIFYSALFILSTVLLCFTVVVLLRRLFRLRRLSFAIAGTAIAYAGVVTLEFRLLQYVGDTLHFLVLRRLSGGNLFSAAAYVARDVLGWSTWLLVPGSFLVFLPYLSRRRVPRSGLRLQAPSCISARWLLIANAVLAGSCVFLGLGEPRLHGALRHNMSFSLYSSMLNRMTDFDLDGFGLTVQPLDHAPLDRSRHPYAVEIPNNGIDENGVGGDLKTVYVKKREGSWPAADLNRRNVILLVVDSARADLLDAAIDGRRAMPHLAALTATRLRMAANAAYTANSVAAMMCGTLYAAPGETLVARFKKLGYRTGVFSAQSDAFGDMKSAAGLDAADRHVDAENFPPSDRFYPSTSSASIAVGARSVDDAFGNWIGEQPAQPFFAYLHWEELHFPYAAPDVVPQVFSKEPLRRSRITAHNAGAVKRAYYEAARYLDGEFVRLVRMLADAGVYEKTTIVVVGDHGEELFDAGALGHGTVLNRFQNTMLGAIVNSSWEAPDVPVGSEDISTVVYNCLARDRSKLHRLEGSVFSYTGELDRPVQIGLFDAGGLRTYDFETGRWAFQPGRGEWTEFRGDAGVIHRWESLVIAERSAKPR